MYFQTPFSFKGRISRGEYILSLIIVLLPYFTVDLLIASYFEPLPSSSAKTKIVAFLLNAPFHYFIMAQGAKRCHDMGHNGWIQLYPIFFLVMMCDIGHRAENKWGPDPLIEVDEKRDEEF